MDTINSLYSEILGGLAEKDRISYDIAMNAFSWLMCMYKPMTSRTFAKAVSCSSSTEELGLTVEGLEAICCSFLVLDKKLDHFRFSYVTF